MLISWPDHVQTVLPITPINTSTAKAVTAAILKLDQAMNKIDGVEENTDRSSLPAAFNRVVELVGQTDMEVQLHVLTCRTMAQLGKVVQLERWPAGLRVVKVLSPAVVLDREEEEETCQHLERHIFTDWLDLDTYFREWLVHHSSEKSDLKVELSHKGVREVLQMDLRARRVELGDKSRVVENMIDRMTVLSTVSQAGVCQSLLMGEILLCVPTSATLLSWRELEENREKMITLHRELSRTKNCLLLSSPHQMHFMAPCPTTSHTFLLG